MKYQGLPISLSLLLLFPFAGCNPVDSHTFAASPVPETGTFQAILRPVNPHLSGRIPNGKMELIRDEKNLHLSGWLDDSAKVPHPQFIYHGKRCPKLSDDLNQDGVIDFAEAQEVLGKILLPLTMDLRPLDENSVFPNGNFSYETSASLSSLSQQYGTNLANFEGRVVLVGGTHQQADIPVVCGVLLRKQPL